jgi:fluoride exporter
VTDETVVHNTPDDTPVRHAGRGPVRPGGHDRPVVYVLAAVGGALGALARAGVAEGVPRAPGDWPWGTLVVNLVGCLLLGALLAALAVRRPDAERTQVFLGTGVLGGFTTYSAFALEVTELISSGRPLAAVAYVAVSVVGGVLAVALGVRVCGALVRQR